MLCLAAGFSAMMAMAQEAQDDKALVDLLRGGGYIIYFRHAQTDWTLSDNIVRAGDWTSCDPTQVRQLSEEGRQTAIVIGEAIRALRIPVSRVLASPYCRTVETASLMDLGPVTTTNDVMNLRVAGYFGGTEAIIARARTLLSTQPDSATNWIVVAHGNVAREATPVYPGEAEGVVLLPDGNSGFTVMGRLSPAHWATLVD